MAKKISSRGDEVRVRPIADRVLIKPLSSEEVHTHTPSGIIIPDTAADNKKDRGTVVAKGEGRYDEHGKLIPVSVSVGDKVIFQWGEKIELNGDDYYIVNENNILAVIE